MGVPSPPDYETLELIETLLAHKKQYTDLSNPVADGEYIEARKIFKG